MTTIEIKDWICNWINTVNKQIMNEGLYNELKKADSSISYNQFKTILRDIGQDPFIIKLIGDYNVEPGTELSGFVSSGGFAGQLKREKENLSLKQEREAKADETTQLQINVLKHEINQHKFDKWIAILSLLISIIALIVGAK